MSTQSQPQKPRILNLQLSPLWSGDLGLTLISISLVILVFLILPLSQAGLRGRFFFDLVMVTLMISGALTQKHSRLLTVFVIAVLSASAKRLAELIFDAPASHRDPAERFRLRGPPSQDE